MKRVYELTSENDEYILKNTNPNENKDAFVIKKKKMQFDTSKFYKYVFEDIKERTEIEIKDKTEATDKMAKIVYRSLSEICIGIINEINEKIFDKI